MLRNRSRAVTSKQSIMADRISLSSPSQNHSKPISNFFGSPRFFNEFLKIGPSETEFSRSPTSILDTKPFSPISNPNPLGFDKNLFKSPTTFSGNKHSRENSDPKPIGLALVNSLADENEKPNEKFSKPNSRKVLFGSKLKIQIPSFHSPALSLSESPKSPPDFGIRTRNSICLSPFGCGNSGIQTGPKALSEMELSEDYTCVISHGPNPKTTHIYDDCVVESCCGAVCLSELKSDYSKSASKNFLSFCYTCKKNLEEGKDIFMYRGEKAFCSRDCRFEEMVLDGEKKSEFGGCF